MGSFDGKVALITGGTSGLGKATAVEFARQGARVVIAARRDVPGREAEAALRSTGADVTFIPCDVTSEDQVRALVQQALETYGRLDCAYNNAASFPAVAPLADQSGSDFDATIASMLRGVFLCMKYEIPAMLATGGGAIVNCSSVASMAGMVGLSAYAAGKAGVEALTRVAVHEYATMGIRVNAIAAGSIATSEGVFLDFSRIAGEAGLEAMSARIGMKRFGRSVEIAHPVLFLCSEGASFITGATLVVDGGYLLT